MEYSKLVKLVYYEISGFRTAVTENESLPLFSGRLQLLGIVLLVFITCLGRWHFLFWFPLSWLFLCPHGSWAVEPSVQIQSPKNGSRIVQDQNSVLVSGKVSPPGTRTPPVGIFFFVDVSGSTG